MATQMFPTTNIINKTKTTMSHDPIASSANIPSLLVNKYVQPAIPAMQAQYSCHRIVFVVPAICTTTPTVSSSAVANLLIASLVNSSHLLQTFSIYTYPQILTTGVLQSMLLPLNPLQPLPIPNC